MLETSQQLSAVFHALSQLSPTLPFLALLAKLPMLLPPTPVTLATMAYEELWSTLLLLPKK
jgi:hypothetical protein